MSRCINEATILGHVGADPESRSTASGTSVVSLRVATSQSWTDKQSGEKQERTEWHNVTAWGKLAEIISQYVSKGSKVYIRGEIQTEKWQDKEGHDRYTTKIVAKDLIMLDSSPQSESDDREEATRPAAKPAVKDKRQKLPF